MLNIIGIILIILIAFQVVSWIFKIPPIIPWQWAFKFDRAKREFRVRPYFFLIFGLINLIFDCWSGFGILVMYKVARRKERTVSIPNHVTLSEQYVVRSQQNADGKIDFIKESIKDFQYRIKKQMFQSILSDSIVYSKNKYEES